MKDGSLGIEFPFKELSVSDSLTSPPSHPTGQGLVT